jgi:hypothetical protein
MWAPLVRCPPACAWCHFLVGPAGQPGLLHQQTSAIRAPWSAQQISTGRDSHPSARTLLTRFSFPLEHKYPRRDSSSPSPGGRNGAATEVLCLRHWLKVDVWSRMAFGTCSCSSWRRRAVGPTAFDRISRRCCVPSWHHASPWSGRSALLSSPSHTLCVATIDWVFGTSGHWMVCLAGEVATFTAAAGCVRGKLGEDLWLLDLRWWLDGERTASVIRSGPWICEVTSRISVWRIRLGLLIWASDSWSDASWVLALF